MRRERLESDSRVDPPFGGHVSGAGRGRGAPLGRVVEEIRHEQEPRVLEIIGIVEDALYRSMREPAPPTISIPFSQAEPRHLRSTFLNVVVRPSAGTPMNLAPGVAAAISDVDRDLSLTLRSMDDRVKAHFN